MTNGMADQEYLELVIRLKMQELARGLDEAEREIKEFHENAKRDLNKARKDVDDLGKSGEATGKKMARASADMEKSFDRLAATATVALTTITAAAGVSIKTFADFQSQLNTLQAVSGATAEEMDALESKAQSLGASTKFSASQMAETSVELAKLGFTSKETIDAIDGIVSASAAAGVPLQQAGELVAGTIRGFGMAADQAGNVADVLASAANASALSMSDLSLSMKYVAPIAAASNQSLTDMTGIMGILANNMIKGEQAGTSLRAMMSRLQNPSSEMSKIMDKLGLDIEGAGGKMKSLPVILGELREKMQGLKDTTKSRVLGELFGTEALSAASVLMNTSNEQLGEMIQKMEDSAGASQEMADIMQQGVNHQLDLLKSAAEGAGNAFGEKLAPHVEKAIQLLTEFFQTLIDLPEPIKDMIVQLGFLGTGLATAGLGMKAFRGLMVAAGVEAATLTGTLAILKGALITMFPLIAAATAAGLALQYGVNKLAENIDENTDKLEADTKKNIADPNKALIEANNKLRSAYDAEIKKITALREQAKKELSGVALDKRLEELAAREAKAAEKLNDTSLLSLESMKNSANNLRSGIGVVKAQLANLQAEMKALNVSDADINFAPSQLKVVRQQFNESLSKNQRGEEQSRLQQEVVRLQKIVDLKEKISQAESRIQTMEVQRSRFQKDAAAREKEIEKSKQDDIDQAKEAKFSAEEEEKEKARKKEEKRQVDETEAYFKELDKRIDKKKETLDLEAALAEQSQANQNDVGERLAKIAADNVVRHQQTAAKKTGACWAEVWDSLEIAGLTGDLKGVGSNHAFEALPGFANSKSWNKMAWNQKDKLPAGAVVIWEQGNSRSGHISIADGQGNCQWS